MAASSTAQPPGVVKTLTDDKKRKRPVKKRRGKKLTVAESEAESEAHAEAEAEAEAARSSKRRAAIAAYGGTNQHRRDFLAYLRLKGTGDADARDKARAEIARDSLLRPRYADSSSQAAVAAALRREKLLHRQAEYTVTAAPKAAVHQRFGGDPRARTSPSASPAAASPAAHQPPPSRKTPRIPSLNPAGTGRPRPTNAGAVRRHGSPSRMSKFLRYIVWKEWDGGISSPPPHHSPTESTQHLGLDTELTEIMRFSAPPEKLQRLAALTRDLPCNDAYRRRRRRVPARLPAALAGKG
eukprot:jgi/Tetstr1/465258/TSEL_009960.t1